jgi:hypothetical protein
LADLPGDAVVVRFGEDITPKSLALASLKHFLRYKNYYGVSVNISPGATADETAARAEAPNRYYCFCTVADILQAGFKIDENIDERGHTNVILPEPPSSDDLTTLADCFTGKRENPNRVRKRR